MFSLMNPRFDGQVPGPKTSVIQVLSGWRRPRDNATYHHENITLPCSPQRHDPGRISRCAPDRILSPRTSTSSCAAAWTIIWGLCRMPV